jgi:hypothetical protein
MTSELSNNAFLRLSKFAVCTRDLVQALVSLQEDLQPDVCNEEDGLKGETRRRCKAVVDKALAEAELAGVTKPLR